MSKTYLITITQADLEHLIMKCVSQAFSLYVVSTQNKTVLPNTKKLETRSDFIKFSEANKKEASK